MLTNDEIRHNDQTSLHPLKDNQPAPP